MTARRKGHKKEDTSVAVSPAEKKFLLASIASADEDPNSMMSFSQFLVAPSFHSDRLSRR